MQILEGRSSYVSSVNVPEQRRSASIHFSNPPLAKSYPRWCSEEQRDGLDTKNKSLKGSCCGVGQIPAGAAWHADDRGAAPVEMLPFPQLLGEPGAVLPFSVSWKVSQGAKHHISASFAMQGSLKEGRYTLHQQQCWIRVPFKCRMSTWFAFVYSPFCTDFPWRETKWCFREFGASFWEVHIQRQHHAEEESKPFQHFWSFLKSDGSSLFLP